MKSPFEQALERGMEHQRAGRFAEAETLYRQAIAAKPDSEIAWNILGLALDGAGRPAEAIEAFRHALALNPGDVHALNNLGLALRGVGDCRASVECFQRLLQLHPGTAEAYCNLGESLRLLHELDAARDACEKAIALMPGLTSAHINLGMVLADSRNNAGALAAFRRALELDTASLEAANNLGAMLQKLGRPGEAIAVYEKWLATQPGSVEIFTNLGTSLQAVGRFSEAIAAFRRALELDPSRTAAHSNLVYMLYYHPDYTPEAILEEHRRFDQQHAAPLMKRNQPHPNERSPERRLRIGYVGANFHRHCQSHFTIPLLSHHDRERFDIFIYSSTRSLDEVTERLRSFATCWRNIVPLNDAQLAEQIRRDEIDILVDLTMHMAGSRLLAFARKPAPVQITWLAYPGTTGLTAIDYRLTDPQLDPPGTDGWYSEKSLRLPETFWCYDPLTTDPPVNALPALANGRMTFGCLNNFCKITPPTLTLWSRALQDLPTARMLILAPPGEHRRRILDQLAVDPGRIDFVDRQTREKYLELYHRIDLCLDTIPYNGHTTSLDSCWMGVPVITLAGRTAVSRAGLSQLKNLGLPELVAESPDQFAEIARRLSNNLPELAHLRATLRSRMEHSPLMDGARFARNVEAAYRAAWTRYCTQ